LFPLIRSIPWIYSWRNRRKFYRWYGELKNLESEVVENSEPEKIPAYHGRLDQIEASINKIRVPVAFFGEVYKLKEHVALVRGKLTRTNRPTKESSL
jgi:phosphoenolpyruvate carboxylase